MFYTPLILGCVISSLNFLFISHSLHHFSWFKQLYALKSSSLSICNSFGGRVSWKQIYLKKEYWLLMWRRKRWGHLMLRPVGQLWICDVILYHLLWGAGKGLCLIPELPYLWMLIFIEMGWMMSNNIWCIISYRFVTDLKFESFLMYNSVSANVQLQILNPKKPETKWYLL